MNLGNLARSAGSELEESNSHGQGIKQKGKYQDMHQTVTS